MKSQSIEIQIKQADVSTLREYGTIPIEYEVSSILQPRLIDGGTGGIILEEVPVTEPYHKDYDRLESGPPESWPSQFNIEHWAILFARRPSGYVAAAALAFKTPELNLLEGRSDLAVLWDIRVRPEFRGQGIGTQLFEEAVKWAKAQGCLLLKAETQNTNVPACRFYADQGFELRAIDRFAYASVPEVANEVMLLWQKELA